MLEFNLYPQEEPPNFFAKYKNKHALYLMLFLILLILGCILSGITRHENSETKLITVNSQELKIAKVHIDPVYALNNDLKKDYLMLTTIPKTQQNIVGFIISNTKKDILIRLPNGKTLLVPSVQ